MKTTHIPVYTTEALHLLSNKKILFANFPADGHFNPLTGLAMHLKNNGNDVRWYTTSTYAKKLAALEIPRYGYKHALEITENNFDDLFPERTKIKGANKKLVFDFIHLFIERSEEYYADLLEIHQSFPFDVVVCDVMFTGIPFISDKMKIPVISIGVAPLMQTSKDLPPAGLGLTPDYSWLGRRKQDALRFLADKVIFKKPMMVMMEILKRHGIEYHGSNVFDISIQKSDFMLQIGSPGFEYKRSDLSNNVRFAGSILPYHKPVNHQPWHNKKLARFQKVVLATQGTVEKDSEKLLVPVLEAFKDTDYLVVITTGGNDTVKLQAKYQADNIIIEDFIPFNDIMPYVNVYITNGGYGGVMLGLENELPMVVAGVHEGKNEINARIGYFNLGINLKTELPTAQQISDAVEKIMKNKMYASNVKALAHELRQYNPLEIVEQSIEEAISKHKPGNMKLADAVFLEN